VRIAAIFLLHLILFITAYGQSLPDKINGYKLHKANIVVTNSALNSSDTRGDAIVSVNVPKVVDIGIGGLTLDIIAEFFSRKESGKVDLIRFKDVAVNGLALDIEDYSHSFEFTKDKRVAMPRSARVSISARSVPRALWTELINSPDELVVKGTAFVFGRFKKFGFTFKRVVPVKIDLRFPNPLR
jgi:hypothetical protein